MLPASPPIVSAVTPLPTWMPSAVFGCDTPISLPWMTPPVLDEPSTTMPEPPLPPIEFPAPAPLPPIVVFGASSTQMPPEPFGRAVEPSADVPITLPTILLPDAVLCWSMIPQPVLPEMTLPSPAFVPPTIELALLSMIPSPLPSPRLFEASVPMKLWVIVTLCEGATKMPWAWNLVIVTFVTLLAPGAPMNRSPSELPASCPSIRGPGFPVPTRLTSDRVGSPAVGE